MPCDHGLPPLIFEPIYKEKVWGGRALKKKLAKKIPHGATIGESWELSAVPGDESIALSAPYSGKTLPFIFKCEKERLVGNGRFPFFPLLYKFIDSHEKLSIQVHPRDQAAQAGTPEVFGKTECWFVVDAKRDAHIICGFKKGVHLQDIKNALQKDKLPEVCNFVPVTSGDVVFVPGGIVHALLGNVLVYEVQQTSDTTFRLYDWGRIDKNGVSRPLHVQEALRSIDVNGHDRRAIAPVVAANEKGVYHAVRATCRYFALEEYRLAASRALALGPKNSFQVVTMLSGELAYPGASGDERLAKGQTALIPACLGPLPLQSEGPAHFLVSYVPDIKADIINPLLKKGVAKEAIAGLGGNPASNDIIGVLTNM
jgi:mannose-6-phosphate isomerase